MHFHKNPLTSNDKIKTQVKNYKMSTYYFHNIEKNNTHTAGRLNF